MQWTLPTRQQINMNKNTKRTGQEDIYHIDCQEAVAIDNSTFKIEYNKLLIIG